MTTQPEALRLADSADACQITVYDCALISTELRRLHEVNQELLEALQMAMQDWENMRVASSASRAHKAARAAIAKATGETK